MRACFPPRPFCGSLGRVSCQQQHGYRAERPGDAPFSANRADRQLDIALAHHPVLVANALGPPPRDMVERCHEAGVKVGALAGTKVHAERHVAAGADIIIVDKTAVGAGASGIACGVVRNNYFQPAMRELMAHSVSVWDSDPEAYSYHPVGYLQISHQGMFENVASIHEQQQAIGYDSVFIEGADQSMSYMRGIFDD